MLVFGQMRKQSQVLIGVAATLMLAACGGPTSPRKEAVPSLSVSAQLVGLSRGGSTRVTATSEEQGRAPIDVSLQSTWTSSDPKIVTATGGYLVATGIGRARVDVTYKGATVSVDVESRRNTILRGLLVFKEVDGRRMLDDTILRIGNKPLGYASSSSDHIGSSRITIHVGDWTSAHIENATLPPGTYDMGVAFLRMWGQNARVVLDGAESELVLRDRDTDEKLETYPVLTSGVVMISEDSSQDVFRIPVTIPTIIK